MSDKYKALSSNTSIPYKRKKKKIAYIRVFAQQTYLITMCDSRRLLRRAFDVHLTIPHYARISPATTLRYFPKQRLTNKRFILIRVPGQALSVLLL